MASEGWASEGWASEGWASEGWASEGWASPGAAVTITVRGSRATTLPRPGADG